MIESPEKTSTTREFQSTGGTFIFDGQSFEVHKPDGSTVMLTAGQASTLLAFLVNHDYVSRDIFRARLGLKPGDSSVSARIQQLVHVIGDGFEIERHGRHGRRIVKRMQ